MPATAPLTDVNFDAFHKLRVSLLVAGDVYWEVVRGGTLGGTPSYTSAGANSAVEYDVAGTTVTGGEVVASGFAVGGGGSAKGSSRCDSPTSDWCRTRSHSTSPGPIRRHSPWWLPQFPAPSPRLVPCPGLRCANEATSR